MCFYGGKGDFAYFILLVDTRHLVICSFSLHSIITGSVFYSNIGIPGHSITKDAVFERTQPRVLHCKCPSQSAIVVAWQYLSRQNLLRGRVLDNGPKMQRRRVQGSEKEVLQIAECMLARG